MGRKEQERGYIITAIFLCQALLSLNKKCLFALLRKSMGSISGGSEEPPYPTLLPHTQPGLIGIPIFEMPITRGLLRPQSLVQPIVVQKS